MGGGGVSTSCTAFRLLYCSGAKASTQPTLSQEESAPHTLFVLPTYNKLRGNKRSSTAGMMKLVLRGHYNSSSTALVLKIV